MIVFQITLILLRQLNDSQAFLVSSHDLANIAPSSSKAQMAPMLVIISLCIYGVLLVAARLQPFKVYGVVLRLNGTHPPRNMRHP
ncbi:hypothetical protein D3C85_1517000 [compost metagenome]